MPTIALGIYGLTRSVLAFYNNWTLKTKTKTWAQLRRFGVSGLRTVETTVRPHFGSATRRGGHLRHFSSFSIIKNDFLHFLPS